MPDAPRKKLRIALRPSKRPSAGLSQTASSVNKLAIPSAVAAIIYLTDANDSPILHIKETGHAHPRAAFRSRLPR
jgi:hypothetical protein